MSLNGSTSSIRSPLQNAPGSYQLAGRVAARRQTTWMRPFNSGPAHAQQGGLSALDKVLIGAVVLAGLAFEGWFFFLAGSSI